MRLKSFINVLLLAWFFCANSWAIIVKAVEFEDFAKAFDHWNLREIEKIPKEIYRGEDFDDFRSIFSNISVERNYPKYKERGDPVYWLALSDDGSIVEGMMITISYEKPKSYKPNYLIYLIVEDLITAPWNIVSYEGRPHDPLKGVGTALMQGALKYAKDNELSGIKVLPTPKAAGFYRKFFQRRNEVGTFRASLQGYFYFLFRTKA